MASISKAFLEEFIEVFKNEPSLWQSKSEIYKDRLKKNKSWEKLLMKYKEINKDATVECVKKKINGLRSSYRRELAKIRRSEESGAGADKVYLPSLWYFHLLDFLRDQEDGKPNGVQEDDRAAFDEPKEKEKIYNAQKRKRVDSVTKKAVEHLDSKIFSDSWDTNLDSKKNQARDEADVFSEGWGMMYRKLESHQKIFAKRLIDEALLHGQLGQLKYSSSINLGDEPVEYINLSQYSSSPDDTIINETISEPTAQGMRLRAMKKTNNL